jgi:hypothetical protein
VEEEGALRQVSLSSVCKDGTKAERSLKTETG